MEVYYVHDIQAAECNLEPLGCLHCGSLVEICSLDC